MKNKKNFNGTSMTDSQWQNKLKNEMEKQMQLANEMSTVRQNVEYTPTPWKLKEGLGLGSKYWVGESKDGKHTPFQSTKEANAAFIVRAVNCHEELLEAVKNMLTRELHEDLKEKYPLLIAKAERSTGGTI